MVRVVGIHGIAQQYRGPQVLKADWGPSLQSGMTIAGAEPLDVDDLEIVFYGELFRPAGKKGAEIPPYTYRDVTEGFEAELLEAIQLAATDGSGAAETSKARTPAGIQATLRFLNGKVPYFAGTTERLIIHWIKQVHVYLTVASVRAEIQERVARAVTPDTAVLIGHSLGSVVAYEAVCAHPEWDLSLVTLGSPLGIRKLIFDRLQPAPSGGRGCYPAGIAAWTNIADAGDAVALAKKLAPLFGGPIRDLPVHNGSKAHDVRTYLTAAATGRAVADGLARRAGR